MKTYLDCIPCFFRQGLEAARMATQDEEKQREVLDRIAKDREIMKLFLKRINLSFFSSKQNVL